MPTFHLFGTFLSISWIEIEPQRSILHHLRENFAIRICYKKLFRFCLNKFQKFVFILLELQSPVKCTLPCWMWL